MSSAPGRGRKKKQGKQSPVGRTAELARERERKSFRARLLAFSVIVLILMLAGVYQFWLRDSSLVGIKELTVVGLDGKTKESKQIDDAVRTSVGAMTTLNADQAQLEEELSRFPRVANARIETSLPDKATVTLSLRKDGSIFGDGANAMLVATDGVVLGPAAGQEGELPLISEGDPPAKEDQGDAENAGEQEPSTELVQNIAPGSTLSGRTLNQALVLGAAPPELRTFLEKSEMSSEGVEVVFDNGLTMLFGDATHVDEKWRAAAALIADPDFETSGYVDLTVPRRPAVEGAEEATEPAEEGLTGDTGVVLPE